MTEKLDGCNFRAVYWEGKLHCGSRSEWKKEYPDYSHITIEKLIAAGKTEEQAGEIIEKLTSRTKKKNIWWEIIDKTPCLQKFCQDNPGTVVYGEIFGLINTIKYHLPDVNRFAAFDLMRDGKWLEAKEARDLGKEK